MMRNRFDEAKERFAKTIQRLLAAVDDFRPTSGFASTCYMCGNELEIAAHQNDRTGMGLDFDARSWFLEQLTELHSRLEKIVEEMEEGS